MQRGRGAGSSGAAPPPPPPPPARPLACEPQGRRPSAPREPMGRPPSPGRDRDPQGGTQLDPAPPIACSRGGRGRRASLHQRAKATYGPLPGAVRDDQPEQYGGRAPHDQSIASDTRNFAHSGRAEERVGSVGAFGGAVHGPPLPPPPSPGRPHPVHGAAPRPRPNAHAGGGLRRRREGGRVRSRRLPSRGRAGGPRRDPPSLSAHPPQAARKPRGRRPPPLRGRGDGPPSPRQDRGAREGGRSKACPPVPAACSHRNRGEQANLRQRARAPHGPRPETASEHEPEPYGGHARHDQNDASDTRFVACPGKAEGRNEAERPPAPLAPPAAKTGGTAHRTPPPPPPHPPARERPGRADPPHGERTTPSQVGGKRDRAAPPPSTPNGAWDWGRTRGGARTAWNGPTSAQHRDRARCARHTNRGRGGGEADAAGARAHTHTKDTRGIPEGQTDRARGTHRPRGMAYQRARVRDTRTGRPATHSAGHRGREGGNGEDTTPCTGPSRPNRPRAPRTHGQGTEPTKAVVAYCATPQPQG